MSKSKQKGEECIPKKNVVSCGHIFGGVKKNKKILITAFFFAPEGER